MKIRKSKKNLLLILSIFFGGLAISLSIFVLLKSPQKSIGTDTILEKIRQSNHNVSLAIESQIRELIRAGGVKESIQLVNRAFQKRYIDDGKCHALLHQAGHLAYFYNKNNMKFLSSHIDKQCNSAYMHGIEAEIILENSGWIKKIHLLCSLALQQDKTNDCYHGVGHSAMGLDNTASSYDLSFALNRCDKLVNGPQEDLSNCYGGVFSEYANLTMNYDTNTGLRYPGSPKVTIPYLHKFEFCQTFDKKYQEACARQMVKLNYNYNNPLSSFMECAYSKYQPNFQSICMNGSAAHYVGDEMSKGNSFIKVPSIIFSYPEFLRKEFIGGVMRARNTFLSSGIPINLDGFCLSFSNLNDQEYCRLALSTNKN